MDQSQGMKARDGIPIFSCDFSRHDRTFADCNVDVAGVNWFMGSLAQFGGGAVLFNHALEIYVAGASLAFIFGYLIQPVPFVIGCTSTPFFSFAGQLRNCVAGVSFFSPTVHTCL